MCSRHAYKSLGFLTNCLVSIVVSIMMFVFTVMINAYAADIELLLGNPCGGLRPRTISIFVLGFWILSVANSITLKLTEST